MGRILLTNIKGEPGEDGIDGAPGAPGAAGPAGPAGPNTIPTQAVIAAALAEPFDPTDVGYDIIPVLGQSNALGRGTTLDANYLDGPDSRVLQFANLSSAYPDMVVAAKEPLFHQELPANTVGFALAFAKLYASTAPVTRRVLLVPCARGNTGFGSTGDYTWRVGQSGPVNLYALAVAQINKALALPGKNRVTAVLWHQGEANSGTSAASYRTDLDAVIADLRARYGSDTPFVLGQMSLSRIAENPTTYGVIDGVHRDTPSRLPHVGFWESVALLEADNLHFSAAGQRLNGQTAFRAYALAKNEAGGIAERPSIPAPPQVQSVTAVPGETSVALSWSGLSAAASYVTRYRKSSDSAWTAGPSSTSNGVTVSGLLSTTGYDFQVAGVNAGGTGAYSATVTATTGTPTAPGFSDTFNRADGAIGATSGEGKPWVASSNGGVQTAGVVSNELRRISSGGAGRTVWTVESALADGVFRATVGSIGDSTAAVVFRAVDADNFLVLAFRVSSTTLTYSFGKRVAGTQSTVPGTSSGSVASASGDQIEIVLAGTSITVKVNGATLFGGAKTVTDFATATKHGVLLQSTSTGAEGIDAISMQTS